MNRASTSFIFAAAWSLIVTVSSAAAGGADCAGSFVAGPAPSAATDPRSVAIGDLDGDGDSDIAVADYATGNVFVFMNTTLPTGQLAFAAPVAYLSGSRPHAVVLGDVEGDGDLDLIVANQFGDNVAVHQNSGNGTFFPPIHYPVGNKPQSVAVGDLDGDGDLDIAAANYNSRTVGILINNGNGTFVGSPGTELEFAL